MLSIAQNVLWGFLEYFTAILILGFCRLQESCECEQHKREETDLTCEVCVAHCIDGRCCVQGGEVSLQQVGKVLLLLCVICEGY
eukprot:m.166805 g.166805  ORF g.166805 m.166805 type:complete len:84 (-) comp14448_c0_seq1:594-845(-)